MPTAQIIQLIDAPTGQTRVAGQVDGDEDADVLVFRQEVCGLQRTFQTSCASYSKVRTGETSHEGYTVYHKDKGWRDIQ